MKKNSQQPLSHSEVMKEFRSTMSEVKKLLRLSKRGSEKERQRAERKLRRFFKTEAERHYARTLTLPRSIPAGRVLVHNRVRRTVDMPSGVNGFRAWTQKFQRHLVPCKCGWSGLPHYRVRGLLHGRCIRGTWRDIWV
jgi:hypothetical protein